MRPCPHWGENVPALGTLQMVSVLRGRTGPCWHSLLHFGDSHDARRSLAPAERATTGGRGGAHPAQHPLEARGPRQGAEPRAGWRCNFQTGFSQGLALLALSVRAEQHNSRL